MYPGEQGPGLCTVCKERLGSEPHFITRMPNGEHVRCRDWSGHPFPYDQVLRRMRQRYRATHKALEEIEIFGRWLADRKRRWPDGALLTVTEADERIARIKATIARLRGPVR